MKFKKGSLEQLSKNFYAYEFDCPCSQCTETEIDLDLVFKLQELREELGFSIKINSGCRCPNHQVELEHEGYETAKGPSQHELGKAADIKTGHHTGRELETAARKVGFKAIGIAAEWVHVDLRQQYHRWMYSS